MGDLTIISIYNMHYLEIVYHFRKRASRLILMNYLKSIEKRLENLENK